MERGSVWQEPEFLFLAKHEDWEHRIYYNKRKTETTISMLIFLQNDFLIADAKNIITLTSLCSTVLLMMIKQCGSFVKKI